MKIINVSVLLFLSLFLSSSSCNKKVPEIDDEDIKTTEMIEPTKIDLLAADTSILKSDQAFAFDFFAKVFNEEHNDKDENFMVSPFSLSMALAMTWNGSEGDTKQAMQRTLGIGDCNDDEVNSYFRKMKSAFENTDPSTKLSIANSIWTNQNVKILPMFISLNKTYYNATVEAVDFGSPNTVCRINKWAADNTNGLIESVIEKTNPLDLMYLLNALYFKGVWVSEFEAKNTSKMSFTTDSITQSIVDMMHQENNFNYTHDENMQVVELPYGNKSFSMMVLLPKEDKKLMNVAKALQEKDYWNNLRDRLVDNKVELYLPKFKTAYSKQLNDVLKDMGMGIAFTAGKAGFSRMSNRSAFISMVNQDTYIATDEVGTEAAAVTSVGVSLT
ncbi:MAG: serpin family protein, partial [Bacteroidales bacterium]|nr:serpin family protein [Bacteroidales bacterium]